MEDNRISALQRTIGQLAQKEQQRQLKLKQEETVRILIEINSKIFEKSMAYTNVIILAGYAGAFTIWSFTKEHLTQRASLLVAILLSISIFVFCLWEVFKMIYSSRSTLDLGKLARSNDSPESFFEKLAALEEKVQKSNAWLATPWYAVLVITITTGFGAGVILMWNFLASIADWPRWPK